MLGGLASQVQNPIVMHYEDIKGFPQTTVAGHAGELVFGTLGGKTVICMKGRFHCYEGYEPSTLLVPIYVLAALGIKALVVTNAAGGVNPDFHVGDVMMIKDQITFCGLTGSHPLIGKNDERFGPRFLPMNGVFDKGLQEVLTQAAAAVKFPKPIHKGVYFGVSGPTYETPSEIQLMRTLGGEAVGMSTVFEVIAASHCGLPVVGLSLITNRCIGPNDTWGAPNHAEVLAATESVQEHMQILVSKFVEMLDLSPFPKAKAYSHFQNISPKSHKSKSSQLPVPPLMLLLGGAVALAIATNWKSFMPK